MVRDAFSGYDKCPIVIESSSTRTVVDFVNIYKGALCDFYFLHNHLNNMILMEDGAPVHYTLLSKRWQEAHGMSKLN